MAHKSIVTIYPMVPRNLPEKAEGTQMRFVTAADQSRLVVLVEACPPYLKIGQSGRNEKTLQSSGSVGCEMMQFTM